MHKIELDLNNSRSDRQGTSYFALTRLAYSPSEGAQVLGISRSKIYELIAAGDLKVIKLGSRTLVPHSELLRFLASLGPRPCIGRPRKHKGDAEAAHE